jgi:hypothetical protein
MSRNLQAVIAAAGILRWSGGMTFGHFGRMQSPPAAGASLDINGITSATVSLRSGS